MKTFLFSILFIGFTTLPLFATIDLYYTEDGRTIQSIRGYAINDDLTLTEQGDESWLISAGQQIGPNGYMVKQSKLTLGSLGKTKAAFIKINEAFLGIGHSKQFESTKDFSDVLYLLPDKTPLEPFYVKMRDGSEGQLFVAGENTESVGARILQGKLQNWISIIHLKYDIPKSSRSAATRPGQFAIRALAVSFSEDGLRQVIRDMRHP